jgi:hypothetical protein
MVERFNGRISDLVKQTRFASAAELETTLTLYLKTYNHPIPQRALKQQTPIQIRLRVFSVDTAQEMGADWWTGSPYLNVRLAQESALEIKITLKTP